MNKMPERARTRENLLSDDEIERVKGACKTRYITLLVWGLLYTGMRISEFIHMNRGWISWAEGVIRIPERMSCDCKACKRELTNGKGEITRPSGIWMPKTKNASRAIPILPEIEGLLRDYFKGHERIMDYIGSRNLAYYHIKQVGKLAGLNHTLFPHALRGTYATMMAKRKLDPFRLKDLMGWKTLEPAAWYVRFAGTDLRDEVLKIWKR